MGCIGGQIKILLSLGTVVLGGRDRKRNRRCRTRGNGEGSIGFGVSRVLICGKFDIHLARILLNSRATGVFETNSQDGVRRRRILETDFETRCVAALCEAGGRGSAYREGVVARVDAEFVTPAHRAERKALRQIIGQHDRERLGGLGDGIIRGGNDDIHGGAVGGNGHLSAVIGNVIVRVREFPIQINGGAGTAAGNLDLQRYRTALINGRRVVRSKQHRAGSRILDRQRKTRVGKTPAERRGKTGAFGEINRVNLLPVLALVGKIQPHLRFVRSGRYRVSACAGVPVPRPVRRTNDETRVINVNAYRQIIRTRFIQRQDQIVMLR